MSRERRRVAKSARRGGAGHDVFISYAHQDRETADAVCSALEADGLRCWIAPRNAVAGKAYADALVGAIEASRLFVLIFSAHANRSDAVLNELEIAANRKRPVLPVRIADVQPTGGAEYYLRRRHWFDAYLQTERRLTEVPQAVRAALIPARRSSVADTPASAVAAGNLPSPASSFIGRDHEITDVVSALERSRLVTLWGTGGVGKTRLALEVARSAAERYPDGAWFIDLVAAGAQQGAVTGAVGGALSIAQRTGEAFEVTIADALRRRSALLVLDNCEHVVADCAALVIRIGERAEGVRVIATTREPLGVAGEHVVRVDPFPVSDDPSAPAIRLFLERARAAGAQGLDGDAAVASIATICRRLDGIAFAIELAAARARMLSPERIATALDERFRLLTGGNRTGLARQQTLRGALDWSYELLAERERTVFRRCSAFAGGFDLDALQAVVAGDLLDPWDAVDALQALVDKSLIVAEPFANDRRYRLLETAREYAMERLAESGEADVVASRHAEHFTTRAAATGERWWNDYDADAFDALAPERDNLRVALEWAMRDGARAAVAARLAGSLADFWNRQGQAVEGFRRAEEVVARLTDDVPIGDRAQAWTGLAMLVGRLMMYGRAVEAAERAIMLARSAGARRLEARALNVLGIAFVHMGRHEDAAQLQEQIASLAHATGDARAMVDSLETRAFVAARREAWAEAERLFGEVLAIQHSHGAMRDAGVTMYNQAEVAYFAGDVTRAISLAREAIELCGSVEAHRLQALLNLTGYLIHESRIDEASDTLGEALALCAHNRYPIAGAFAVQFAAEIAASRGDVGAASRLLASAGAMLAAAGAQRGPTAQRSLERLRAVLGERESNASAAYQGDRAYDAAIAEAQRIVTVNTSR